MLFHGLYDGGGGGYINHFWCDLLGPDLDLLRKSWNQVLKTHSILRSAFYHDSFKLPVQAVLRDIQLPIKVMDLQGKTKGEQALAIKEYEVKDRAMGFDFKTAPLMRISLLRLDENRYRMLWSSHHILFDGWSRSVLMGEFLNVYDALSAGKILPPVEEDRYEDFIRYIERIDKDSEQAYWKKYISGVEQATLLPFIGATAERTKGLGSYASLSFQVNKETTTTIENFAQRNRVTINTIMQGVWAMLLHRYTGSNKIVYGVIVSGRPGDLPGVEQRVGMYINTLPLHSTIHEEQEIAGWLQGIQNDQVASRQFQSTPLQEIQEYTGVKGDLFDSLFVFENYPISKVISAQQWGLAVENVHVIEQTNYPLNIVVSSAEEIGIEFIYNLDLIQPEYITGIRKHFEHVLLQLTGTGQGKLGQIELLDASAKHILLENFNATKCVYPTDKTLVDLFEKQVEKTPDAIAVVFDKQQYSYKELNERSNQLGHYLRSKGVKEETLVPICMDRSLQMIIGIWGIVKAGAAYVPIDPEYPADRIRYMLQDTAATIALCNHNSISIIKFTGGPEPIAIDAAWPLISQQPVTHVDTNLTPGNVAYVIYTSGSTGQPKGVMNEHAGVVNRLLWAQDYYGLTSKDRVLQKTTFCFDVSVWELFWPSLVGSKLVFAKPGGHKDPEYLKHIIEQEQITLLHFVPSMLGVFLSDLQTGECSGLKKVLCSGEALKPSQVAMFIEKLPGASLHNLYGPTEAAIDVTYWSLTGEGELPMVVPIGKPVANTSIYILDQRNELVPIGGIGEIHIGGVQVARGYLNRPELSAEKFVINPFDAGNKMYRTGDLGRWLPDGNIEYLGRIDEQVKIRGFRVELGEIESCMTLVPGIKNAKVVVTETDPLIGKKLNAYLEVDEAQLPLLNNYLHLLNNKQVQKTDLHVLPNGLPVLSSNGNEVKFLYKEIFKDASYLKHGITLPADACVMDIGANVGFFSVFLNVLSEDIRVYSFEPIPEVFNMLAANRSLYNIKGKAFKLALLDKEDELEFVYYPQMTILSGIGEDRNKVKEVVRSYVENSENESLGTAEIDALLEMKLESRKITIQAKTLSQVIAEEKIEQIHLLKVDVENSEHLVIGGLAAADWDRIENIIIEVHDVDGRLDKMKALLEEKGFQANIEKENLLSKDDVLYNIYALRNRQPKGLSSLGENETIRSCGWQHPQEMVKHTRVDIEKQLPDYMVPSAIILMDQLPLTSNGKIDKKALPDPESNETGRNEYLAPRTEMEKVLVSIWEELLKKEPVGIHDNFFELGGHSLLAMRVISSVRRELEIEMVIKAVFLHPTIMELAQHLEANGKGLLLPAITVQTRPANIPLSFSQERLWFIDKLEGSLQYHLPSVIRLKGKLNSKALTAALQYIVNRHEVLRTVVLEDHGMGYQSVIEKDNWQLQLTDGSTYRSNPQGLQNYIRQLVKAPFNLSGDYMLRASLLQLNELDHLLVVTMHHIAADGWSTSIIVRELVELYEAFDMDRPVSLAPLSIQYADYAIWQRKYLQGEVLDKMLAYWKNKLEGVATLQLPTDFPRPAVQSTRGARTFFSIDRGLAEQLQVLSRQEGTTLFMTLLAGFKVLLYRYSGQQDICVGTPIASRTRQEVEALIGFFINTLALRSDLSNNPSFTNLLQQVKATTLEAYAHQEVPFEKVVEIVGNERDMSRNPLFQVLLTMQNTPEVPELRLGEITLSLEETEHNTAQLDIICNLTETPDGLLGSVEYCTDLFSEATILQMMQHFTALLQAIVKAPQQRIAAIPMLSLEEENKLVLELNNTAVNVVTGEATIVDLFESIVTKNPDQLAVVFESQQLSYGQLNERANQLAAYLVSRGVKAEKLVPICMERSIDMLVGIWAILKAGAVYVPVDPAYPADRISYMLEDTTATIILTNAGSLSKLPNEANLDIISIDDDWTMISTRPVENLAILISPNQLAYIIYTSGSTGKPKGVMIEHAAMLSYLLNDKTCYVNTESSGAGSFIHLSYTFDASLTAMFMPLLAGRLVVIGSKESVDVFEDSNLQKYAPYDFIKITPSHLTLLQPKMKMPSGRLLTQKLVIGGEALFAGQFSYFAEEGLDVEIINEYGPTEATVGCSVFSLHTMEGKGNGNLAISIGKPINNVQLYILGAYKELMPAGATGELCIAGAGLARGYLNRTDLTEEKFIKNPFGSNDTDRIYKTGDLARWLPDGNIEYIGRKDEQVKIRGYRIELGEIEGALQECDLVNQVAVLAKENKDGAKRLVAYIVPCYAFDKEGMKEYLESRLPEYMIPVQWVELETLPLTSNGKVDRKALPNPDELELLTGQYVAPRNDFEKALAVIWQDLLDVEAVGIHDNFFELGGDSIIIIQIVSRARRSGYEFQVSDVFTYQTIARLSALVEQQEGNTLVVAGEQEILTGPAGLLPIQQWYFEGNDTGISHFNQSVLLGIDKAITENELNKALQQLMAQHDVLRFNYRRLDGKWQQEYGTQNSAVETEDIQSIPPDELAVFINERAAKCQRSLDIEKGELVRMVWIRTPQTEDKNRLLIVIHHLAVDGISWRILLEDLELLLTGIKDSVPTSLGRKGTAYRDWYNALEQYGASANLISQQKYWEQAINSYQPLKVDHAYDGPVTVKDMGRDEIRLGAAQTKLLLREVPAVYHTEINDMLMAALAITLCEWADSNEIVIGLEGHGREQIADGIDTSHTVGWLTSLYPVLLQLSDDRGAAATIKAIKEQLRSVPDKGIGYGVIKYINQQEKFAGKKSWDIVFNYFGQLDNVVSNGRWLSTAAEDRGDSVSENHLVKDLLSVNGQVQGGELILNWAYSTKHYKPGTIRQMATQYKANLEMLVAHCMQQQQSGPVFTPSDYGLGKEITNDELDTFLNEPLKGATRRDWIEGLYRLSGLQQGMLFHGLYDRRAGAYTEQLSCELKGPDLDAFKKSWDTVISRHSILRSGFYHDAFMVPVQCVYREVDLPVVFLDYRGMSEAEQDEAIREYDASDLALGFNFKSVPLMRIALMRLTGNVYRMLWTSHHILFDGWSMPVLMEEFLSTYDLLAAGKEPVKATEDRYEDYIRYIERTDKAKAEKYWRHYLKEVDQSTLLPFIRSTAERTKGIGNYQSLSFKLDTEKSLAAERFAQQNRITVNTLVQGVWSWLLHQYTGSDDIVFGVTVSGRPDDLPGVEQRVGMYINTLPLHSHIDQKKGIVQWLQGLQDDQIASRHHQYTALQDIQGWTGVKADLFDSLLVVENYPVSKVIAAGKWSLQVDNVKISEQTNFPLSIFIAIAEQLSVRFSYNTDLLKTEFVQEISSHFEYVLLQVIAKGSGNISDIELLTAGEKQQLLVDFNNTATAYPTNKSIIELFEEQVKQTPGNIAIVMDDEKVTYAALNEQANQLARCLQTKGVQNDSLVPICIERSVKMIVGMLGILKAGGAYVPIDPAYPAERILFTIEDTAAKLIVSNEKSMNRLPAAAGFEIVSLDSDWTNIMEQPIGNLSSAIHPGQLAYVIYTSGSTGRPKGVMIQQSNAMAFLSWCRQEFASSKFNIVYAGTSICFDLSVFEIFFPLSIGKPLRLLENGLHIGRYLPLDSFVMTNSVPGIIQSLLAEGTDFTNISVINMAGEPVPLQVHQALDTDKIEVRNLYGPSEDTTYSTIARLDNKLPVTIGKPVSNTTIYIVNRDLQLVPVGVTGEICISGAGIAKGYLNRKELTGEKFVSNPFSEVAGSVMYRTGDWGRWQADGNIEYLGRMDEQVKIRGYRIELGEIETVLQQSQLVSKSVVLAKQDKDANKRLVAYVVPKGVFYKDQLINTLKAQLPEYMVPALWVELEDLPLTPNGKIDRKALPDPDATELLNQRFVAPRNELEEKLAAIWKEILQVEQVGVHDNFFELGGHSLLVMRLISSVRRELKIELAIATFFELVTIEELANYIKVNQLHVPVSFENHDTFKL
jgi:amino acid adenylation domain-containing protein/non-ribosomal peptide synthase protein (TIGR01720 family)/FkbM family methyltransferase